MFLRTLALVCCAVALPTLPARAQELTLGDLQIMPHLQYRPRFLVHEGRDFREGSASTTFSHRARLGLQVRAWDWLDASVQVQDVRIWGEETDTLSDYAADYLQLDFVMGEEP